MRLSCAVTTAVALLGLISSSSSSVLWAAEAPDYATRIAPLLTRYCGGCHQTGEAEGAFSVSTWEELQKGGKKGPAFLAGDSASSRMMRMLTGSATPRMPPEGEPQPTADEITLLKQWIDAGAIGPKAGMPTRPQLVVPQITPRVQVQPVLSLAFSPDGQWLAAGGSGVVFLMQPGDANPTPSKSARPVLEGWKVVRQINGLPGKVQSVQFSSDSSELLTASGVTGLSGTASLWNVADGQLIRSLEGHTDALYEAALSPNGKLVATTGYDRKTIVWDRQTGERLKTFEGHNGAVYDVDFSPDSTLLGTASADDTCKLWSIATGERLDTLGQPLKECYSILFSRDGKSVLSTGADSRIRIWTLVTTTGPGINPQRDVRFAHEGPVLKMAQSPDGSKLVTAAENGSVKIWEAATCSERQAIETLKSPPVSLAISPDSRFVVVGRMDGSLQRHELPSSAATPVPSTASMTAAPAPVVAATEMATTTEAEPNQTSENATPLTIPGTATGLISGGSDGQPDFDLYRFKAHAGQTWIIEVNAARSGSPLDSQIEVLTSTGERIPRVQLQSVKESYFTFRGKNGSQPDDFRVFNWEEMELNELLYCNGEVVRLWLYPRGPDSGFLLYKTGGSRRGYFDTTGLAHALGEPCYVVQPHAPDAQLVPNGLPVFTVYYENDDDAQRELGSDSRLTFTAPADGEYLLRINDVRQQQGDTYKYQLTVRHPQPSCDVTLNTKTLNISPGGAREFQVTCKRRDGYEGPVQIDINGLPEGLTATTPLTIEAGQESAIGLIQAAVELKELPADVAKQVTMTATTFIGETPTTRPVEGFTELKTGPAPKVLLSIVPIEGGAKALPSSNPDLLEFEIEPGQTIMLKTVAQRIDFADEIRYGTEDAGRNLPFGVFVDNIGLNGLTLLAGQTEREFFITASKVASEQSRLFHLRTPVDGGQASRPVMLHVRKKQLATNP